MKEKILYAITTEDVKDVAQESGIPFTKKDLPFLEGKIGDFFGSKWYEAVDHALCELKSKRARKK